MSVIKHKIRFRVFVQSKSILNTSSDQYENLQGFQCHLAVVAVSFKDEPTHEQQYIQHKPNKQYSKIGIFQLLYFALKMFTHQTYQHQPI